MWGDEKPHIAIELEGLLGVLNIILVCTVHSTQHHHYYYHYHHHDQVHIFYAVPGMIVRYVHTNERRILMVSDIWASNQHMYAAGVEMLRITLE